MTPTVRGGGRDVRLRSVVGSSNIPLTLSDEVSDEVSDGVSEGVSDGRRTLRAISSLGAVLAKHWE